MSTEVEQRVVQMTFNNKAFESATRTTMDTLDKLKKKLNFEGINKSFDSITEAASRVDLGGMNKGIDGLTVQFDALSVFAFTTFQRIANNALDAGLAITKSLTIEPIALGFSEYETKLGSIQTILSNTASKGTTMEQVNTALNDLNKYADKTIYNFQEMTRNIGTFTAAGVDLDTSTQAIKGIANLAAASGSTSQQASTAMYQLSQALSSGTVKLQDWNSVVNAGMGGQLFQDSLIETAELHGVNVRQMIKEQGSFRETLTEGAWLTSEVLTETLNKFTGDLSKEQLMAKGYTEAQADEIVKLGVMANDAATKVKTMTQLMDTLKEAAQSGWAESFEILVGDFEEAKKLFTGISDVVGGMIGDSANARNELLKGWKELGGRDDLLKGLSNIANNFLNVVKMIGEAFREVFPRTTAEQAHSLTKSFANLTEKLMLSENALKAVKALAKVLFSLGKIITTVLALPLKFIPGVLLSFDALLNAVLKIVGPIANMAAGIIQFVTSFGIVEKIVGAVAWVFEAAATAVGKLLDWFKVPITFDDYVAMVPILGTIRDGAAKATDRFKEFANRAKEAFLGIDWGNIGTSVVSGFESMKTKTAEMWVSMKEGAYKYFTYFKEGVTQFIDWVDWDKVVKAFTGIVSSKIFLDLASFLKNIGKGFKSVGENSGFLFEFRQGVTDSLDQLQGSLSSWQQNLKADTLKSLAMAILMITGAIFVLSGIDANKLAVALAGVTVMMTTLVGVMWLVDKQDIGGGKIKGLITMAASLLILSKALATISNINPKQMATSVTALGVLMMAMVGYAYVVGKNEAVIGKANLSTIAFATGMLILAAAVTDLANIQPDKLVSGIMAAITLTTMFIVASAQLSRTESSNKASFKMIALSTSLKQMAVSVEILSRIPFTSMVKGLIGVMSLLGGLTIAMNLMNNSTTISTAIGLMILSGSLVALSGSIKVFSMIKWETMLDGLAKVALLLSTLGLSMKLMPPNMVAIGAGLLLVSGALYSISVNTAILGSMKWSTLLKGLFGLGGSLAALAVGLNFMVGSLPGSAALVVASGALLMLSTSMAVIGNLDLWTIIKALVGLAGSLAILGVSATMLMPLAGVLLGLSGGFLGFSAALLVFGAALGVIGAGLTLFAAGFIAFGAAIIGSINLVVETLEHLLSAFIKIIPKIAAGIGALLASILKAIGDNSAVIVQALTKILSSAIDGLVELTPKLVEGLLHVLTSAFESLVKYSPNLAKYLAESWISIMESIKQYAGPMIESTVNAVAAIFDGIFDALKSLDVNVLKDAVLGAGIFAAFLGAMSILTPMIPGAMIGLLGFAAVIGELVAILALVGGISQIPGVGWLMKEGGKTLEMVGSAIGGFFGAILGGLAKSATSVLPDVGSSLGGFMTNATPFFDQVKMIDPTSISSIKTLAEAVLLITGNGLVDNITSFLGGDNALIKFGQQLTDFAPYYINFSDAMRNVNPDLVAQTAMAVKTLGEFANLAPKVGGLNSLFTGKSSLSTFGKELAEFAPYLKSYAENVKDIDTSGVEASTNAGKMIAELANTLPNAGGALGLIMGENSLATFGKELAEFAPYIRLYSEQVRGIDTSGVEASTNAGKMIAQLADVLPNSGGALAWVVGDNTLVEFAKSMCEFGPAIMTYSKTVTGLNVMSISESVRAGLQLSEFAGTVPANVELVGSFGKQMVKFGEYLKKYFGSIANLDLYQLDLSITTVNKLIAMLSSMTGVDTNAVASFSEGLDSIANDGIDRFIAAFKNGESKAIEAVNTFIVSSTKEIDTRSADFAKTGENMMTTLTASLKTGMDLALVDMSTAFEAMASSVQNAASSTTGATDRMLDNMLNAVRSRSVEVAGTLSTIMNSVSTTITTKSPELTGAGAKMIQTLVDGMVLNEPLVVSAVVGTIGQSLTEMETLNQSYHKAGSAILYNIAAGMAGAMEEVQSRITFTMDSIIKSIESHASKFKSAGDKSIKSFADGISGGGGASDAAKKVNSNAMTAVKNEMYQWETIGKQVVEGFAKGISDNTYLSDAKAKAMADEAAKKAKEALDINSPSRVGDEIGMFFVKGFANGIDDNMSESTNKSRIMAEAATNALSSTLDTMMSILNDDMDYSPTITPVLDLSNVNAKSRQLNTLFSTNSALGVSSILNSSIGSGDVSAQNGSGSPNISLVQNNYSPKALSATEIYRQTKNQFSRLKGLASV